MVESLSTVKPLRIMSYNVHGCKGMDGAISTKRIASVIAQHNPDVVALQELDAGRKRSAGVHQAEEIAHQLEMALHFHSAFRYKEGEYGNAILSRYPMTLVKKSALPRLSMNNFPHEPRGAIWATVEYQGVKINIINTHLSLWSKERLMQINALLGPEWLQHPDCVSPMILCGDFNLTPQSPHYKKICIHLQDSQSILVGHCPRCTWAFAGYALRRIDYVFVTTEFDVKAILVPQGASEKVASDHWPLIVDLNFKSKDIS